MQKTNSAETFIRLLTEAYEADYIISKTKHSAQTKAQVEKFKQQQLTAMYRFRDSVELVDCVQFSVTEARDRRLD